MRQRMSQGFALCSVLLIAMGQAQADPLTRARQAYNNGRFDEAVEAAREAMQRPASSNSAAVVLARAHLERYRSAAMNPADLEGARAALAQVRPDLLSPQDRVEFLVGQGVALFVEGCDGGCFAAAAEFFEHGLAAAAAAWVDPVHREPIFEWWATALDRQAQGQAGPDEERVRTYERILKRAEAERATNPDSTSATFWIAAAARGAGDFERAWGAAIAGWIRARHLGGRGETLRTDLNRFVVDVLLPERAKQLVPDADPRPQLEILKAQWIQITGRYK